jgi:hypothetical protein
MIVSMLPPFDATGRLPEGIHATDWAEFEDRFGASLRRKELLVGLAAALHLLRDAGCPRVFIGGSFVTAKLESGDFDPAWDMVGVDADTLDPIFFDFEDERAAQKQRFGGEFFPAQLVEGATGRSFLEFFQHTRDDEPVGIVAIELEVIA